MSMLKDMGIQVWFERPDSTVGAEAETKPEIEADATTQGSVPAAENTLSSAQLKQSLADQAHQPARVAQPDVSQERRDSEGTGDAAGTLENSTAATIQPIEFLAAVCPGGVLLCESTDIAHKVFIGDLLGYVSWLVELRQGSGHEEAPRIDYKPFKWPQLLDSKGTPTRSLAAFLDSENIGDGMIIATSAARVQIAPWLPDFTVLEVPPLADLVRHVDQKRELWQRLAK